jgi:hypothetical protein
MAERDWRMLSPCSQCPFVNKDMANTLRPGRLSEIKDGLRTDGHFICHKTSRACGDGSNRQCAGAIAWQEKRGYYPNQLARIAMRLDASKMGHKLAAFEKATADIADPEMKPTKRVPWAPITDEDVIR